MKYTQDLEVVKLVKFIVTTIQNTLASILNKLPQNEVNTLLIYSSKN